MRRTRKSNDFDTISKVQQEHITALGLSSVAEYRRWCRDHGFSRRIDKGWRERCREREVAAEPRIRDRLKRRRNESRKCGDVIRAICSGTLTADDVATPGFKQLARYVQTKHAYCDDRQVSRRVLARLLLHVEKRRAKFFDLRSSVGVDGDPHSVTYLGALVAVAAYQQYWVRPLDEWKPRTHNAGRQFASLIRHLFAVYNVPVFLDAAWFAGNTRDGQAQRNWYRHVGKGLNIRTCSTPIVLTKKMAHAFLQAPSDVSISEAFRWAQVEGLGGDERLARALFGTRLGNSFEHENFWTTVIRWFVSHPMLDRRHVGPIVDYLHAQKFTSQDIFDRDGRPPEPPQPNLTMKGRSPDTLLNQVERWHSALARDNRVQVRQWSPQPFGGFELLEGDLARENWKRWTVRELVSTQSLLAEGRSMKHCVGSYADSCSRGTTSIWSMEVETRGGVVKAVTIEVRNGQRLICQVRGRANRRAAFNEQRILRCWAAKVGLKLASYA